MDDEENPDELVNESDALEPEHKDEEEDMPE